MIPRNAEPIIAARLRGDRPELPVVVSFVGDIGWANPHVYVEQGVTYDWRFLYDLEVYIAVKPGIECRDAVRELFGIAQLYPTLVDIQSKTAGSVLEIKPMRIWPFCGPKLKELFQ